MRNTFRRWWKKPAVHAPGTASQRVTWLELFYDLVFVVVIARLAHHLNAHPDAEGLRAFLLLFVPVWWVWVSGTYYNERFETYDLSFRVFVFLQMLAVAAMAATAEGGVDRTASGFALAYAAARLILTGMWFRAGWHNPPVRPVTTLYVLAFTFSVALWVTSAVLPPSPLSTALRVVGLLAELGVPLLTLPAQRRVFLGRARKLPERFGLFVLIVLGESLVGVVDGLTDAEHVTFSTLLRFLLGFMVGFGLWWVYFDNIGRREPRSEGGSLTLAVWVYLHLPFVTGVAAIGAMLAHSVEVASGVPEGAVRWILCGAFAVCYLCMAGLEGTLEPEDPPLIPSGRLVLLRVGTGAAALLVPLLPLPLSGVVAALVALHLVHMGVGVRAWFGSSNAGRTDVH
ncbi:low temperature requirement protein A [Deinococcus sonorensis]|uniref:Low temperature requirement protein A n=2 Tax=Deinococcus sonorensis TaxID=309891 RepID=A0AAU7U788_9DEIO